MAVRHRSLRFGALFGVAVVALGVGAFASLHPRADGAALVVREREALVAVEAVARCEEALKTAAVVDRDRDGTPEYGALDDLAGPRAPRPLPPGLRRDASGTWLDVAGYRIEVLLPTGSDRQGHVALGRGGEGVSPALAATQFVVAGTPRRDVPSGLRAFYLDASGRRWEAEGVCDGLRDPFRPPPLHALATDGETPREGGPVWRLRAGPPLAKPAGKR